jgi:hypothetical protein
VNGPIEIQNLQPGDQVFNEFGKPVRVLAVFDQGMQECVSLWSGRAKLATCTPNHRWLMSEASGYGSFTVKELNEYADGCSMAVVDPNSDTYGTAKVEITKEGPVHCWDITVDSPTSLYCLQNGLVTHNTLSSAIILYFSALHFRRDSVLISALLDQSGQAISYLDKFLKTEQLIKFFQSDNIRRKKLVGLPANDFTIKSDSRVQVVTASKKGANSPRASFLCLDECDLIDPAIIAESAFIADPYIQYKPDGTTKKHNSIFVYLSSRKSNIGPIQSLLDEADGITGDRPENLKAHKWSAVDWMETCPEEQSQASKGGFPAFMNTETLATIWSKEEYDIRVPETQKTQYNQLTAYEGCRKCPAWIACQGRSVKQRGTSYSLRDKDFVGSVLAAVKIPSAIIAQTLNWKPETTGLVFKSFSNLKHYRPPREVYLWLTGRDFKVTDQEFDRLEREGNYAEVLACIPTKKDLYNAMIDEDWTVCAGIDFGYNPDPAVVITLGFHKKRQACCILDVEAMKDYANKVWAAYCAKNVFSKYPVDFVNPDMADPAAKTYFKGFGVRCLGQKPKHISTGISFIRGMLWNPVTETSSFMVLDDGMQEGHNRFILDEMMTYTHAKDALGNWSMDKFNDANNHAIDALRYALHPFTAQYSISVSGGVTSEKPRYFADSRDDNDNVQEFKEVFESHILEKFGLHDVLKSPEQAIESTHKLISTLDGGVSHPLPDATTNKKKSSIKFSF